MAVGGAGVPLAGVLADDSSPFSLFKVVGGIAASVSGESCVEESSLTAGLSFADGSMISLSLAGGTVMVTSSFVARSASSAFATLSDFRRSFVLELFFD